MSTENSNLSLYQSGRSRRSVVMFLLMILLGMIVPFESFGELYTLHAKHRHKIGSCVGELIFDDHGVQYHTSRPKDQRNWSFTDIQEIQFLSERELNILTYEDSRQRLGGDRLFKFALQGENVPPGLITLVDAKFAKPVSNRLTAKDLTGQYEIPVKHLHRVGGCQGKLVFTDDGIMFVSNLAGESRQWRFTDLQSIASTGPYGLRLGTYEHGPLQFGDTKEFRFQLKEPLNEAAYRFAWAHINQLPRWRPDARGKFDRNNE